MYPVEVVGLSKTFVTKEGRWLRRKPKPTIAVDHIDFHVAKGEIFGLLGPNGAGKTTTIKMLCTLIAPTDGEAYVNGHSIVREQQQVRENLGAMLTGERTLYWKLSGRENLEYFAALYHLDPTYAKPRIDWLLELMGLTERAGSLVENYSTGMRIRLSFAKALLNDAPVLLFDEPTMSLDPQSSRLIRDTILDLKRQGHAVILTTHYMEEADLLSDRVAIIDHGRIIALASPQELKQRVKSSDVIEIEARHVSDRVARVLETVGDVSDVAVHVNGEAGGRGTIKIHAAKGKEVLPTIMEVLVKKDVGVTNVKFVEPTLEDVFIELTGRGLRD